MKTTQLMYSPQSEENGHKGGGGATTPRKDTANNEDKIANPEEGGMEEASLADESLTSGDLDGGGGMGTGLTGGDPAADSGDMGPTPDKAAGV